MASTRAIADSGRTGLDIKIKRTNLQYNNNIFTGNGVETKETLGFGEFLYFDSDDTLVIGDSAGTSIDQLPIVKFHSREEVSKQASTEFTNESFSDSTTIYPKNTVVYFTEDGIAIISDGINIPKNHKIIKLFDKDKAKLISYFDSKDTSGITRLKDENNNSLYTKELSWPIINVDIADNYYKINTSDVSKVSDIQSDYSQPGCFKINVTNMKLEYTPCASLYISPDNLNSVTNIKNLKTAYSKISSILTFDGFIIICFSKRPSISFQLCFVGG